jgi:putative NADH-flavin reductase
MRRKILVLGATGGTGREVVAQGLGQGREITVLVRDRARLGAHADRVRVIIGSLPDGAAALGEAVRGQDAVVSALGVGQSFKSRGLMGAALPAIVAAMQAGGVRRLIVMSAAGVGDTLRDVSLPGRLFARTLLRDIFADKKVGEEAVRASSLDWTIAYPTLLTNGQRTSHYRAGEHLALHGIPSIARADVADFLLSQLEDGTYSRRDVVITS